MIGNEGIPLDAVRVDFAAGAVEQMVIKLGSECHILHVEGQGSLLHPGSTAIFAAVARCTANSLNFSAPSRTN